jgi:hypothetical protein
MLKHYIISTAYILKKCSCLFHFLVVRLWLIPQVNVTGFYSTFHRIPPNFSTQFSNFAFHTPKWLCPSTSKILITTYSETLLRHFLEKFNKWGLLSRKTS